VRLSPLGTSDTNWPIVPAPDDGRWWVWTIGGMRIGRENRSTQRKPAPMLLCQPQIPHDLTWDRTRAAVIGIRRLIARTMAWLIIIIYFKCKWVSTRWQWYYSKTQHTNYTLHKITHHAETKHSTQNYTNNKGDTTHNEHNANTITTTII
jgi:hypothetical protein